MQAYLNNLTILDIAIVISHLVICLCIGFYHFRRIKTAHAFCTVKASKILPSILLCTIFATEIGGGTIIGYIDEICKNPIVLFFIITQPFLWIVTSKIITQGIYKFKECATLTQVLHKIWGKSGKYIGLYTVIIDSVTFITLQSLAFASICNYFFRIDYITGLAIGIVIINTYSIMGGFRGIIAIDVFQFLIFFVIIPASYIVTIQNTSFTGNFLSSISLSNYDIQFSLPIVIGLVLASLLPEIAAPFMQRYLMLAHDTEALKLVFKKLFRIAIPFMLSICLIGYLIIVKSPTRSLSPNIIFSYIDWLPLGIKGMMISGLFAIIMSTADSHMNATSTIILNDFLKVHFPKVGEKGLLLMIRIAILLLSLFPFILLIYKDTLFQLMSVFRSFGTYILVVPLSTSLLGYRVSNRQFLYSFLCSILFIITTILLFDDYFMLTTFSGIIGSFIGLVWNKNLHVIFIKRIRRLHPLLCDIAANLLSKIHKLKCVYIATKINKNFTSETINRNNFSAFIFSYYFIFSLYLDGTKSLLPYLIIIGYVSVLIFMVREILFPIKLVKKYSNIYYYTCLTFCLPLVSSYLLFYYTASSYNSYIWVINSLLTTFLLYQFLNATAFLISMTIGFILGCILYIIEVRSINLGYSFHLMFYIYLSLIFISQIIAREKEKETIQKDKIQKEKLGIIQTFGEMIAHEIKTPVSITSMQSSFLEDIIANVEKNKIKEDFIMKKETYEKLKKVTNMLTETSQYGINTVDNLLTSLRGSVQNEEKEVILIKDVVEKSIKEYTLYVPELKNIKVDIIDNFQVECSYNSLKHVIINLIKNSYTHNGSNVKIEVRAENNKLYCKDYGKGIEKKIIKKIFNKFFTHSKSGTGIGLSFCKLVMEDIGGSIKCKSIVGEYTNFILYFPKKT